MLCAPQNFLGLGVAYGATPTDPVLQSATADAAYPPAGLSDEQTSPVCKWSSLSADYYVDVALNIIPDGDAEQATVPADWVVTDAALTRSSAVAALKGSYHFALAPTGTGAAQAHVDITVQAGTYWQLRCATRGNTRTARVHVLDMERGGAYYLAADGTWTTTPTELGSTSASAWTETTVAELKVPTFAEWGRRSGTLRIVLESPAAAGTETVYFDEVLLYPSKLDLVAVVGHSFPALARLRVFTYADYWHGGAATTLWDDATGCMLQPTGWIYSPATTLTAPFVRIQVSLPAGGTAIRAPQIAELFLGRTVAFPRSVGLGTQSSWTENQPRAQTRGALLATRDLQYPVRKIPIVMQLEGEAEEWPEILDEIVLATGVGAHPCVLLLTDLLTSHDWCCFGNFADNFRLVPPVPAPHQQLSWDFEELPVPLIG